jgi:nucleoid-associated protein YgaU
VLLGAGLAVGPGASLASAAAMPSLASLTSGAPAVARPASDLPAPGFAPTAPDAAAAPDPSWVPTRPSVRAPRGGALLLRSTRPSTEASTEASAVVVRRGDSLWSIVAAALGPGATDAEIARTWPLWYAQNRALIGADPDVLLPGMQLQAPERSAS